MRVDLFCVRLPRFSSLRTFHGEERGETAFFPGLGQRANEVSSFDTNIKLHKNYLFNGFPLRC